MHWWAGIGSSRGLALSQGSRHKSVSCRLRMPDESAFHPHPDLRRKRLECPLGVRSSHASCSALRRFRRKKARGRSGSSAERMSAAVRREGDPGRSSRAPRPIRFWSAASLVNNVLSYPGTVIELDRAEIAQGRVPRRPARTSRRARRSMLSVWRPGPTLQQLRVQAAQLSECGTEGMATASVSRRSRIAQ